MYARSAALTMVILLLGTAEVARAQGTTQGLFGERTLNSQQTGRSRSFVGGAASVDTAGRISGNERFIREARQPGQFVGSDSSEVQRFVGGVQAGNTNQGRRGLLEGLRALSSGANQPGNQDSSRARKYRTRVSVGFAYRSRPAINIQTDLSRSMARMRGGGARPNLSVSLFGRTAILRGTVSTDHQRELAGRLALLEAGVSRVQNEIVVQSLPRPPEPSSP